MARYIRVSIQGRLFTNEVWSVNPVFSYLMPPVAVTPEQALAAATAVAAINPGTTLAGYLSTAGTVTGARLEFRGNAFELEQVGEFTRGAPFAGTGSPICPPQTATVISLRSPFPGASARGRAYWPALAPAMSTTTGRLTSASRTALLTDWNAYMASIADAILAAAPGGDTVAPVIWSPTLGTSRFVTSFWVGDVIDTQRRRRDDFDEAYSTLAYSNP